MLAQTAGAASRALSAAADWIALACRLAQIGCVLTAALGTVAYRRVRFGYRREQLLTALGSALARACEILGPLYTKIAQLVSYRTDILPPALLAPFTRLQNDVAPPSQAEVHAAIKKAYARPHEVFAEIDPEPIGCGCISVVIVARLAAEPARIVVLKLPRPGIRKQLLRDVACLRLVAAILVRFSGVRGPMVKASFENILKMLVEQCDPVREARNLQRLHAIVHQLPGVRIPRVYEEVSNEHCVVMDYVSGNRWFGDRTAITASFEAQSRALLRAIYHMTFLAGVVHCDLHPGNLIVDNQGSVWLIDGGLIAELSCADRDAFGRFFLAFASGDIIACAQALADSTQADGRVLNDPQFHHAVTRLVRVHGVKPVGQFLVIPFVSAVFAILREFSLHPPPGFIGAIWALATYEGLVRSRYATLDFQREAMPFMASIIIDRVRLVTGT